MDDQKTSGRQTTAPDATELRAFDDLLDEIREHLFGRDQVDESSLLLIKTMAVRAIMIDRLDANALPCDKATGAKLIRSQNRAIRELASIAKISDERRPQLEPWLTEMLRRRTFPTWEGQKPTADECLAELMVSNSLDDLVDEVGGHQEVGAMPMTLKAALAVEATTIDRLTASALNCDLPVDAMLVRAYHQEINSMERFWARFSLKRRWKPEPWLDTYLRSRVCTIMEEQIALSTNDDRPRESTLSMAFDKLVDEIRNDVNRRDRRPVVQLLAIRALVGGLIVLHRIDTAAPSEIVVDGPMIPAFFALRRKIVHLAAEIGYPDPESQLKRILPGLPPDHDEPDDP